MKHEKIIKREDGSSVMIAVSCSLDTYRDYKPNYRFTVATKEKGKRTWLCANNNNDYTWRKLSMTEREKFNNNQAMKYISEAELNEAYLELWQLMKPDPILPTTKQD